MKERWFDIPGLNYEISDTCIIKNKKTGYVKKVQTSSKGTQPTVTISLGRTGEQRKFSLARLLYSAIKGINPCDIGSQFLFTFNGNKPCIKNLKVLQRNDILLLNRRKSKASEDGDEFYSRCERFCHCARIKDIKGMMAIIEEYKSAIMQIIRRKSNNQEICEKIYQEYINALIIDVVERRRLVIDLVGYTRKIFRHAHIYNRTELQNFQEIRRLI